MCDNMSIPFITDVRSYKHRTECYHWLLMYGGNYEINEFFEIFDDI